MARAFWALSSPKNSAKSLNWRIRSDGWYVGREAMVVMTSNPAIRFNYELSNAFGNKHKIVII